MKEAPPGLGRGAAGRATEMAQEERRPGNTPSGLVHGRKQAAKALAADGANDNERMRMPPRTCHGNEAAPLATATDDLVKAADIARAMVMRYGMSASIRHISYECDARSFLGQGPVPEQRNQISDEIAEQADNEIRQIVQSAFDRALAILEAKEERLRHAASLLLQKETLEKAEILDLIGDAPESGQRREVEVIA